MGSSASPTPGFAYALPSDPLVSPQPKGVTGQTGTYTRNARSESYYYNGICWMPNARDQVFRPPVMSNLVCYFDPDDVDADDTNSSAYTTDNTAIVTWKNKGSGGNCTGGADARYLPFMHNGGCNGRNLITYDTNVSALVIGSSATSLGFLTNVGTFEMFIVFRADICQTFMTLIGSGTASTDESFAVQMDGTNTFSITITRNGGTPLFWSAPSALAFSYGKVCILNLHGNGTAMTGSIDGGTEGTSSNYSSIGSASGTMSHDMRLGAGYVTGTGESRYWAGAIGKTLIYSAEHTTAQRKAAITELKRWYSL